MSKKVTRGEMEAQLVHWIGRCAQGKGELSCECQIHCTKDAFDQCKRVENAIRALIQSRPKVSREFVEQLALRLETFVMPMGEHRAPFEVITEMFLIPSFYEAGVEVEE